jgi:hypothetical protein
MDSETARDIIRSHAKGSGGTNGENGGTSPGHDVSRNSHSNAKSHKRKPEDGSPGKKKDMNKRLSRNRVWDGTTRRDRNVDTRMQDVKDESEKEERRPKKKVACFIGYSGEGYHGMQ